MNKYFIDKKTAGQPWNLGQHTCKPCCKGNYFGLPNKLLIIFPQAEENYEKFIQEIFLILPTFQLLVLDQIRNFELSVSAPLHLQNKQLPTNSVELTKTPLQ